MRSEIDVFASLGRDLGSTTHAETAAKIILDAADLLIGWDACYLILYDPAQGGSPRPLYTVDTIKGERIVQKGAAPDKPSENMLQAIHQGGFISQYEEFFDIDPTLSFGDPGQRTLSQIFVPVATDTRTVGVLSIQSYETYKYQEEQLQLMKNLASHCAGALERIWAQEKLSDLLERLKVLHQAAHNINASLDVERVCHVIYETVEQVMPCNDFVMDGYDETTNEIVPIYAVEHPRRRVFTKRYYADHGLAGEIVRKKQPLLFNSQAAMDMSGIEFELFGTVPEDPTHSILAVPMVLHGKIYGMISAQSYQQNAYTQNDRYLLEVLASHAAIAIENARLFESVQMLANTDPLTGTLNRRRFFELAEREYESARERERPFAIIMLDVDDFKKFNDSYGHKVGDLVLMQVAETCRSALREADIFGRLGGEEFALVLPDTPLEYAVEIASRLCGLIHERDFNEGLGDYAIGAPLSVTVSVGVSALDPACRNLDALMERADKAMYAAKHSGRDRVQVWGADDKNKFVT